jgi:outer membrane protein TolC
MGAAVFPAYAEENQGPVSPPALSVDEVVAMALQHSLDLKQAGYTLDQAKKTQEDQWEQYRVVLINSYLPDGSYAGSSSNNQSDASLYRANSDLKLKTAQYEDTKKQVARDAFQTYFAIVDDQKELGWRQEDVTQSQKSLQVAEAKYRNGRLTEIDLNKAREAVTTAQNALHSAQIQMTEDYWLLAAMTGNDRIWQPQVKDTLTYQKINGDSPDPVVGNVIDNSLALYKAKEENRVNEIVRSITSNDTEMATLEGKMDNLSLTKTIASITDSVWKQYYQILDQENAIVSQENQLTEAKKNLELAKKRFDWGIGLELDVLKADMAVKQLEQKLFSSKLQHEVSVKAFNEQ